MLLKDKMILNILEQFRDQKVFLHLPYPFLAWPTVSPNPNPNPKNPSPNPKPNRLFLWAGVWGGAAFREICG